MKVLKAPGGPPSYSRKEVNPGPPLRRGPRRHLRPFGNPADSCESREAELEPEFRGQRPWAQSGFRRTKVWTSDQSQRTRLSIIEAAIEVYGTDGIEVDTQERIAQRAGISRPLILRYFPRAEDLFTLAMKYVRGNLQRLAIEAMTRAGDRTVNDRLSAYVSASFTWIRDYPIHARAWMAFLYRAGIDLKHHQTRP